MPALAPRLTLLTGLGLLLACTSGITTAVTEARQGRPTALCKAACEHVAACEVHPDFDGVPACTAACVDEPEVWTGECLEPMIALQTCELELSCADLRGLLRPATPKAHRACDPEARAFEQCGDQPFIYFQF